MSREIPLRIEGFSSDGHISDERPGLFEEFRNPIVQVDGRGGLIGSAGNGPTVSRSTYRQQLKKRGVPAEQIDEEVLRVYGNASLKESDFENNPTVNCNKIGGGD